MDVIAELEDGQTLNLTPEWLIEWEKEQIDEEQEVS